MVFAIDNLAYADVYAENIMRGKHCSQGEK
jgi:hypothetical protein